ncbi:MAG: hypothetical protein FWC97_10925 [Treponema sp.]|nr:hypothetical protein [Treponema sp.]
MIAKNKIKIVNTKRQTVKKKQGGGKMVSKSNCGIGSYPSSDFSQSQVPNPHSSYYWLVVKLVILFTFVFFSRPLFAVSQTPWWLSFEQGIQRFRSSDYGAALMLFEDARRGRRSMYEQMERDFIHFLSMGEVRRLGDHLDILERFARYRFHTAASAALDELFFRLPGVSFNNSALSALAAFDKLKDYPEAEFWIGEVFRVEGDLPLALAQYRRALSMRDVMKNPGFAVTIQYQIANIHRTRQEFTDMEKILLTIVNENDIFWSDAGRGDVRRIAQDGPMPYALASASFARAGMTRTLETHGIDRFLEMYRYDNRVVEPAHRLLGFHHVVSGRASAGPHLMFAFLIQNTVIIEELRRRQFDFTYTNLPALMQAVSNNPLLLSFIDEVEYFRTAYYLGAALFRAGHRASALNLWSFLADQPQGGEWHSRAVMQLRNPTVQPILERP